MKARYGYECDTCNGEHDTLREAQECAGEDREAVLAARRARYQKERAAKGTLEVSRADVEDLEAYLLWAKGAEGRQLWETVRRWQGKAI